MLHKLQLNYTEDKLTQVILTQDQFQGIFIRCLINVL